MIYAPILIPTLCRETHLRKLIDSLSVNPWAKYTELYVAVDFSTQEKYNEGREKTLKYLKSFDNTQFKEVHIIERNRNYGAFGNIDDLQNEIAERYDRFISIPDDMVVSPNFIEYMDKCLKKYEKDEDVIAVCGYNWPVKWDVSEGATCFRQNITCTVWGIGYWSKKYNKVRKEVESGEMLAKLPEVIREKRYQKMIDVCKKEYVEAACYKWSYGHQWLTNLSDIGLRAYLAVYDKYAIAPVVSKTRNYGFDGSGEYCQGGDNDITDKFSTQNIDTSYSFDIIENTKDCQETNHKILNEFDARSPQIMQKTRRLIWLCEHIGVWSAKLYCYLTLPWDFAVRAYNKYIRR